MKFKLPGNEIHIIFIRDIMPLKELINLILLNNRLNLNNLTYNIELLKVSKFSCSVLIIMTDNFNKPFLTSMFFLQEIFQRYKNEKHFFLLSVVLLMIETDKHNLCLS